MFALKATDLGLQLFVQELLLEVVEGALRAVVVQVQRVQHVTETQTRSSADTVGVTTPPPPKSRAKRVT